ncbi:MAG TPA: HAMP domain-containing sensor histidine kinase [Polyangiaceae bacterium]|nr:HAMP domain-containing sensor histidine kinase [Polyangiaceae bacterium]
MRPREDPRLLSARKLANRKIGFVAHAIVCVLVSLLVFVAGGALAFAIVFVAWLVALATHGFFAVLAPVLRERWTAEELARRPPPAPSVEDASREARALSELSASIAHEIRNPITAAKSLVQQIRESPGAGENAEYARVAVEELDRVERSISHLLRYAREEKRNVAAVKLEAPLRAALELHGDRIRREGVRIETGLDDPGTVDGDEAELRRVFANLVENALDALAEGDVPSPAISVGAGRNLAGTESWVEIADNGPGIPEDALEDVFTPFYTRKEKGTGLGLSLCRKIVAAHGGRIEARSEPGRGATFTVTLPARADGGRA